MKKIFLFLLISFNLYAHQYHESFLEADFNPDTESFETTLTLSTPDIVKALRLKTSDFNQDSEIEAKIFSYLQKNFTVKINNEEAELIWWGIEPGQRHSYIYFEIAMSQGRPLPQELEIKNTLFFFNHNQVNRMVVSLGTGFSKKSDYTDSHSRKSKTKLEW